MSDAMRRDPYAGILRTLASTADVVDDTDVNCDVSFVYIARYESCLTIRLSMVGPYATVMSSGADGLGPLKVLSTSAQCENDSEASVLDILNENGFKVLSAEELRLRVPLRLCEEDSSCTLYSALFEAEGEAF
ncbi:MULTISPECIES: hypothetical protein [unclassified Nonomuraea]|uniref:hypothetical protein n=1 Tax=unclassified Nonomuraea TaxID=2593643 RepID=UPI0033C731F5